MKKKKKKKFKSFKEFSDKSSTSAYEPPKNLVDPAPNDTGYAYIYSEFKKISKKFAPGISF